LVEEQLSCRQITKRLNAANMMWLYSAGHTETRAIMPLKRCVR